MKKGDRVIAVYDGFNSMYVKGEKGTVVSVDNAELMTVLIDGHKRNKSVYRCNFVEFDEEKARMLQ